CGLGIDLRDLRGRGLADKRSCHANIELAVDSVWPEPEYSRAAIRGRDLCRLRTAVYEGTSWAMARRREMHYCSGYRNPFLGFDPHYRSSCALLLHIINRSVSL